MRSDRTKSNRTYYVDSQTGTVMVREGYDPRRLKPVKHIDGEDTLDKIAEGYERDLREIYKLIGTN